VADHEIFVLDPGVYYGVAHRGTFHGRYANTVTLTLKIKKTRDCPSTTGELVKAAKNNDIGVGVVMIVGALVWGFFGLRFDGLSADMHAQRR
jgi:hypothetical protein